MKGIYIIITGIIAITFLIKSFLNFFERKNFKMSISLGEDEKSSNCSIENK